MNEPHFNPLTLGAPAGATAYVTALRLYVQHHADSDVAAEEYGNQLAHDLVVQLDDAGRNVFANAHTAEAAEMIEGADRGDE